MAIDTKTTKNLDGAAEQFTQLNERFVQTTKRAATLYLDSYEKAVEGATAYQQKLAEQSKSKTLQGVVAKQVDLTRELASAYTSTARELIA